MLEIAFYSGNDNIFLDKERKVIKIDSLPSTAFSEYKKKATEVISSFSNEKIIIIETDQTVSINYLALALFIISCYTNNKIECAVFRTADRQTTIKNYKPFVALTIAVKYVMRLCHENTHDLYKSFLDLGYLRLHSQKDYLQNKIYLKLEQGGERHKVSIQTTHDAIKIVGMLKALSLAKKEVSFDVEIKENLDDNTFDEKEIIDQLIEDIKPWIS